MNKILIVFAFCLSACNAIHMKPNSMDKTQLVYADRGGYSMKFAVKQELEERGYKVVVGKSKGTLLHDIDLSASDTMNARYVVKVFEKDPGFYPIICMFSGLYWWSFSVSIADQKTGQELLAWAGRGCANGALGRLHRLMDQLEIKNPE